MNILTNLENHLCIKCWCSYYGDQTAYSVFLGADILALWILAYEDWNSFLSNKLLLIVCKA